MKELGAKAILITMFMGLVAWFAGQVFGNSLDIVRIKEREKSTRELLIEIKMDVKEIRKAVNSGI